MNTKGNQRYQETKNRIKKAFLELLEQEKENISVSQLCKQASVHRTTFYNHYEDINYLLQEMVADLYAQLMAFLIPRPGIFDANGFKDVFLLAQKNRKFFLYYFKNIRPEMRQEMLVPDLLLEHSSELMQKMQIKNRNELMYQYTFFSAGSMALMINWLKSGCLESPEDMGNMMKYNYQIFLVNITRKSKGKTKHKEVLS